MKPEFSVVRRDGIKHNGRVEVTEPDGFTSCFHLWGVERITIKCDSQPEVKIFPAIVYGQLLTLLARTELKIMSNSATNTWSIPDGHNAYVSWPEAREKTPSI